MPHWKERSGSDSADLPQCKEWPGPDSTDLLQRKECSGSNCTDRPEAKDCWGSTNLPQRKEWPGPDSTDRPEKFGAWQWDPVMPRPAGIFPLPGVVICIPVGADRFSGTHVREIMVTEGKQVKRSIHILKYCNQSRSAVFPTVRSGYCSTIRRLHNIWRT